MFRQFIVLAVVFPLTAGWAVAESGVGEIPRDWKPEGMRVLRVVEASASTALGPQYAPSQAVDGRRDTKWVATVAPSGKSPQWITLKLLGPQQVVAVAVFGEPVDNDGVIDGAVQVENKAPGGFSTVAEIKSATSPSWLATFEAVQTGAVRLLVTRSGGPSTHTDVFEIVVLGRSLSPEERKAHAAEHLQAARQRLQVARSAAGRESPARPPDSLKAKLQQPNQYVLEVAGGMKLLEDQLRAVSGDFGRWDSLEETQRGQLVERIDALLLGAWQLPDRLARVADIWPPRAKDIASARQAAAKEEITGKKIVVGRAKGRLRLISNKLVLDLDETSGAWQATWLGGIHAALRRAQFKVEVDGKEYAPAGVAAEVKPITDQLGTGLAIVQRWGKPVQIERRLRVYRDRPGVVVAASITNQTDQDVSLGTARILDLSPETEGWWYAGRIVQTPGVVSVAGISTLFCEPIGGDGDSTDAERNYDGTGVLALAHQGPAGALAVGFLTGLEARPELHARFRPVDAGTALLAEQRFLGRKLRPGETLRLDPVYVAARADPFEALEHYGDAVAAMSRLPARRGPTSLWCSWYPLRMGINEDVVIENAAVAARHFKPLGMEVIQLDHGWQRGNVTGDWVANERFPHGLKWLSEQLKSRYGLRLGLWIAPTDVADVSQTFKQHPDWMLKDDQGKPRVNWQWYWKPNPNCYELDASHPEGAKFIEETFSRLSAEGASYYKIDFIASCGGEQFHRHDPYCTPGWGVLRRAMEAVRTGAGAGAWIRYCQTPPLLSVGLADSAYGGPDTSDAGTPGVIDTLRTNARSLAAGYWINNRLYRREVCDMSVGMKGPLWEVRMKMALMCLAGCSTSFSDDFRLLEPSRIRLMQRCLPPGGPPMRPVDLLRRTIPSIWHVHCQRDFGQWEVVGLFNFEDQPQERTVEFASLGLDQQSKVVAFECWEEKLLGVHQGRLTLGLPPHSSRILFLHRLAGRPQVVGTDMHLLGGYHEIKKLTWDADHHTLAGVCQRMPGISGKVYVYVPAGYQPHFDSPPPDTSAKLTNVGGELWVKELRFQEASAHWTIRFDRAAE